MKGPTWTGAATYDDAAGRDPSPRIVVLVRVGELALEVRAVVDTGGVDILDPAIARQCGLTAGPEDPPSRFVVRGDLWNGHHVRGSVTLVADQGLDLDVEATWFVPDDADRAWVHPSFLGYHGSLSRFRFAVDPAINRLWFAPS